MKRRGIDPRILGLIFGYCGYEIVAYMPERRADRVLDESHIETETWDELWLRRDARYTVARLNVRVA